MRVAVLRTLGRTDAVDLGTAGFNVKVVRP